MRDRFAAADAEILTLRRDAVALVKKASGDAAYNDVNYVFPTFVTTQLPPGLVGLIIAAIFAAAMSSIAAELNSLSTATLIDFYKRHLKPDATERNLTGAVNAVIEGAGLRIVAQKRILMTRREAETFYAIHKERPFFGELVEFMISAPVVVQVLEGENAVARYREIMGATNPENAAPSTIRKQFARSVGENTVHGSDSAENAKIEIAQFFSGNEIVG